ncbi:hypothetical protein [Nocardia acidivorans]|nr:hypothetical protein [Nocardia acidivorans]
MVSLEQQLRGELDVVAKRFDSARWNRECAWSQRSLIAPFSSLYGARARL